MPPKTPQPWQFLVTPIRLTDLVVFFRESDVSRPLYLPYGTLLEILTAAINGGSGTSILLQTNSVDNPVQDVLNLIEGTGITITDDGAGGITFDVTVNETTADNGLTETANNIQLGGTLIKDTTIDDSTFDLAITKDNSGTALFVINYDTGYGLYARSDEGIASVHAIFPATTSGIETVMEVRRGSTLNATGSIYGAIDFYTRTTLSNQRSGRIVNGWATATDAIRTSSTLWYGVASGVDKLLMSLRGSGDFALLEYGVGTFEDTAAYLAGFAADGSVVEVDPNSFLTAAITSINSLTAASQTLTTGTSGTAPAVVSATATHTINIPLASVASVTEGTISNVEYEKFNSKWGTFISTQAASSSATIDFTGLDGTYKLYTLVIEGLISATNIVELWVRMGTGATPTWASGASDYIHTRSTGVGTSLAAAGTTDSKIVIQGATVGNASTNYFNGTIELWNPASASQHKSIRHDSCSFSSGGTYYTQGTGRYAATTAVTGIRILCSSGNITSGNFTLYGSL